MLLMLPIESTLLTEIMETRQLTEATLKIVKIPKIL